MAERLQHGDDYSARRLLRAALRCCPENTLLALRVPSGMPEPRTAAGGWSQRKVREYGVLRWVEQSVCFGDVWQRADMLAHS
jgi:hypothetical protein